MDVAIPADRSVTQKEAQKKLKYMIHNIQTTNKMHFNVYYVFYSLYSHQHVSATTVAIFRVKLLLQAYKDTNLVSCVAVTPQ
jgi:hypothetical protein